MITIFLILLIASLAFANCDTDLDGRFDPNTMACLGSNLPFSTPEPAQLPPGLIAACTNQLRSPLPSATSCPCNRGSDGG